MNLQHAVQHDVSLVRLYMNKPAGTRGLTPILTSPLPVRSEPKAKERVHSHFWTLETLSPYLRPLRVLVLKHTSTV